MMGMRRDTVFHGVKSASPGTETKLKRLGSLSEAEGKLRVVDARKQRIAQAELAMGLWSTTVHAPAVAFPTA